MYSDAYTPSESANYAPAPWDAVNYYRPPMSDRPMAGNWYFGGSDQNLPSAPFPATTSALDFAVTQGTLAPSDQFDASTNDPQALPDVIIC